MKHNTLTITTDFGDRFAAAQLHAVIDSLGFTGRTIENHSIPPFVIHSGAFEMKLLCKYAKKDSVHLGVVDPGVGGPRAGIIIKTKNCWFVGPDNGLLYPAAKSDGIEKIWRVNESKFENVTKTFHGRDVFVKAAVYLAKGKKPEEFGSRLLCQNTIIPLNFVDGQVLHIDAYGNLKVFWSKKLVCGDSIKINKKTLPVVNTFEDVKIGQPLAYQGSSGTLELAINQGSFAKKYRVSHKDILNIG